MNALSLAPQYPVGWIKDFMRFYKQRTQLGVKEALAYDKRAPILLLRSFDDDHIAYAPWELQERSPRLASLNTLRFVLEEALAKELSRKGPPIAIGAPGEVLPPIGAYRQYCGEAEWQGVVLERMSEAQSIVVIASETRWLSWELEQIAKNNYVEKCMLFFPPLEPFAHADRVTAVSRAISSFLPPAASTTITAPGLVALLFGSSNSITALFDKTQSKESYILAVQAGLPVT